MFSGLFLNIADSVGTVAKDTYVPSPQLGSGEEHYLGGVFSWWRNK